jgi:hypothetical protein
MIESKKDYDLKYKYKYLCTVLFVTFIQWHIISRVL